MTFNGKYSKIKVDIPSLTNLAHLNTKTDRKYYKGWYDFYMGYGGMSNLKMISYVPNLIMGSTLSKMLLISGVGVGMRWLIDKMIPEI
ncbi:MAG: hypothetical protein IJX02_02260 [Clostridia bacterium]|nr:hypothetical protein [Clostridia bacterium]